MNSDDEAFEAFEEYCDEQVKANEAWKLRWPNHCKNCEGAGGFPIPQTYWDPPDYDICVCTDKGKCPRCMEWAWPEDIENMDVPCKFCGWNWGHGKDDAAPQI